MSGFLYFVPVDHPTAISPQVYEGLSLARTLEGVSPEAMVVRSGPGGRPGWLLRIGDPASTKELIYAPSLQTWATQAPESYSVGYWTDAKPTAKQLRRDKVVPGYFMELGNGESWEIPLVYVAPEARPVCRLPSARVLDDRGEWINGEPRAPYRALLDVVGPFFDAFIAAVETAVANDEEYYTVEIDRLEDRAVALIATNYRVWRQEVAMLELLVDVRGPREVLQVACDCDTAIAWIVKKKDRQESAGCSGPDGPPVE